MKQWNQDGKGITRITVLLGFLGSLKLTFSRYEQVNAIQMKETVEENASTTERVFQDRQYQV